MSSDSFQMPQYVLDRVMNKRGRVHVFDALQPERTAFVVIDMQNAFVKGKVKAETALAIMPKINQLAAKVRELGGRVAWVLQGRAIQQPPLEPRAGRVVKLGRQDVPIGAQRAVVGFEVRGVRLVVKAPFLIGCDAHPTMNYTTRRPA